MQLEREAELCLAADDMILRLEYMPSTTRKMSEERHNQSQTAGGKGDLASIMDSIFARCLLFIFSNRRPQDRPTADASFR